MFLYPLKISEKLLFCDFLESKEAFYKNLQGFHNIFWSTAK